MVGRGLSRNEVGACFIARRIVLRGGRVYGTT